MQDSAEAAELQSIFERLTNVSHKLSSELYKAQGGAQPGGEAASADGAAGAGETKAGGKDDDVIDADYKDVN